MTKNINIHIRAKGTGHTKQQLDSIGDSAKKTGSSVSRMGDKSKKSLGWLKTGLARIAGPLGFVAIASAAAAAAVKIAKFFDNLKTKIDEAVRKVEELRSGFGGLFEAMDAFDEKSREKVTKDVAGLLLKTGVTKEAGLPVIDQYTRQFQSHVKSGQLTQEQYNSGLEGMLGYSVRHGGDATKDLIMMMSGWGMNTPEQQGEFRRMIAAGAQKSGLTDADVIGALGRGMPTIKALGWTPAEAVEKIALLASGESGRKKMSLPSTTLQGIMAPQLSDIDKFGIPETTAEDPRKLLAFFRQKSQQLPQKDYMRMLTKIYGTEAAAGVYKLTTTTDSGIAEVLVRAAGPQGAEAEQVEEQKRMTTMETLLAQSDAKAMQIELARSENEKYQRYLRVIGEAQQKELQIRHPVSQWITEFLTIGKEREKEEAAFQLWAAGLTEEEEKEYRKKYYNQGPAFLWPAWQAKSPKEKVEALLKAPLPEQQPKPANEPAEPFDTGPSASTVHINYDNSIRYYPVVGDQQIGPRAAPGDLA